MKRFLIYVIVFFAGEASHFGVDLLRHWWEVNYGAPLKAKQNESVVETSGQQIRDKIIHLGHKVSPRSAVKAYMGSALITADMFDGYASTLDRKFLELAEEYDTNLFTKASMVDIEPTTAITPFVYYRPQEQRRGLKDPNAKPVPDGVAVVNVKDLGGVDCVVGATAGRMIFIPLANYRAAGLPMR